MHDILGHRPLSNISENGVDVGFDGDEDAAEYSNTINKSIVEDDVHSTACQEEMDEDGDEDNDDEYRPDTQEESFPAMAPDVDPPRTRGHAQSKKSARCTLISQHQQFLMQMMRQQNEWVREQREETP